MLEAPRLLEGIDSTLYTFGRQTDTPAAERKTETSSNLSQPTG